MKSVCWSGGEDLTRTHLRSRWASLWGEVNGAIYLKHSFLYYGPECPARPGQGPMYSFLSSSSSLSHQTIQSNYPLEVLHVTQFYYFAAGVWPLFSLTWPILYSLSVRLSELYQLLEPPLDSVVPKTRSHRPPSRWISGCVWSDCLWRDVSRVCCFRGSLLFRERLRTRLKVTCSTILVFSATTNIFDC